MTYLDHEKVLEGVEPDVADISKYFAKIMTSRHNQHVVARIGGKAGKGKSWLGLALCFGVAKYVAEIIGGEPSDYFSVKNDLAVISKSEVMRVMKNPKKFTIKFLDDVAAKALNARNFRDPDNIDLNGILTTFRPNRNLVVLTAQAGFLIDKVPRSLSHYMIEMDQMLYDKGISVVKCFEMEFDEASGQIYRHYLRASGGIYKRHICYAPPIEVTEAYEIERGIQLDRMMTEKEKAKSDEIQKIKKKDYAVQFIDMLHADFGLSIDSACNKAGISRRYYDTIKA